MTTETFEFQTEVREVLNLVVHSLYSNRDIFLRELISNASDACDKLRFAALQDTELTSASANLGIRIAKSDEHKTLSVIDTGVGMTRDELVEQLGTIAHSGTKKFLNALSENQSDAPQLIGQFGVGFYAAFLVADKVRVTSRKAGSDDTWTWTSEADGTFTIEPAEAALDTQGTHIELHLKEDAEEYLSEWRIRELIKTYSEHVAFPIEVQKTDKDDDGNETTTFETVNESKALWTRAKNEVSDEEYEGFYKHIAQDFTTPLSWSHNKVEGRQNYTSLLYLPARSTSNPFAADRDERKGLKLYIRRVFIMDAAEELLPPHLRFMRGVVDAESLPLNVSRETLQDSQELKQIGSAITKRAFSMIESLAKNDADKFKTFMQHHGSVLKEGLVDSFDDHEKILSLLRFATRKHNDELISLDQYIEQFKGEQNTIYYMVAETPELAKQSPLLEAFAEKDIDVLLLSDRIDPWITRALSQYKEKSFQDIAAADFSLDGDKTDNEVNQPLVARVKTLLGDTVEDVRVTGRLKKHAATLLTGSSHMDATMRRMLELAGQAVPDDKPVLDINPEHALVQKMLGSDNDEQAKNYAELLLDQARLLNGDALSDPAGFVARINELLSK